jgi:hypothetical protein
MPRGRPGAQRAVSPGRAPSRQRLHLAPDRRQPGPERRGGVQDGADRLLAPAPLAAVAVALGTSKGRVWHAQQRGLAELRRVLVPP